MPAEWLKLAANPLKGNGHLSRRGVAWFAELVFVADLATKENRADIGAALQRLRHSLVSSG